MLTARTVAGHSARYGFSMIPLVFVASLLQTVRAVRKLLESCHSAAGFAPGSFRLPPVLVLIENNFAYGAATYVQPGWAGARGEGSHSPIHPSTPDALVPARASKTSPGPG